MPAVVFVTAHDQYAIQAFEINAIDYLPKPVTRDRFAQALTRAKVRLDLKSTNSDRARQIISLLESIASPRRYVKRLRVRSVGRTVFVDVEDVASTTSFFMSLMFCLSGLFVSFGPFTLPSRPAAYSITRSTSSLPS